MVTVLLNAATVETGLILENFKYTVELIKFCNPFTIFLYTRKMFTVYMYYLKNFAHSFIC